MCPAAPLPADTAASVEERHAAIPVHGEEPGGPVAQGTGRPVRANASRRHRRGREDRRPASPPRWGALRRRGQGGRGTDFDRTLTELGIQPGTPIELMAN